MFHRSVHGPTPTDSSLLQDGVRVLTRTMQRASPALADAPGRVRNWPRSIRRRVLAISRQAPSPETRTRWSTVIVG